MGTWTRGFWIPMLAAVCGVAAGQSDAPERPPLERAQALIVAGDLTGARRALSEAAPVDSVDVDALLGLIELRSGDATAAAVRFQRVLKRRPNRLGVWVYLGQARYVLGDLTGALDALREGASVGETQPGYFLLRARTERRLTDWAGAEATLERGRNRFPNAPELLREQAFFRLDLGLVSSARTLAKRYRDDAPEDAVAWQLVAEIERRTGDKRRAADVLEQARLRLPGDVGLTTQLARLYADLGLHGPSADLFASVASRDSSASLAAADQFRLAGRFREALEWNARVVDEDARVRQRIAVLVASDSYDRALAVGMRHPDVSSESALLLAHAAAHVGRFRESLQWIDTITDPVLADRAGSLRRIAADCERVDVDCTDLTD